VALAGLLALSACGTSTGTDEAAAGSSAPTTASAEAPTDEPTTAPAAESSASETPAAGTDVEEPDNGGGAVDVVTTYFGWDAGASAVLIGGYVTGVLEDGGTCTATLTQGGRSVTGTSVSSADARTTACAEIQIPGSSLGSGAWSAVLSYQSPRGTGEAQPVTVEVP
jgi:hypothetical protein